MDALRFKKKLESDGEIVLTGLPTKKGDEAEVIVIFERQDEVERSPASGLVGRSVYVRFARGAEPEVLGDHHRGVGGMVGGTSVGGILLCFDSPHDYRCGRLTSIFLPWAIIEYVEVYDSGQPKNSWG